MNRDFEIRNRFLYGYTGNEAHVIIPDSVIAVREKAFRFCNSVVSIKIPDSVMAIEWGAFSFCENLEQMIIPPSVEFISVSAIEGCKKLKTIIIEDNPHYYAEGNRIFSIADENIVISTDILTS